MHQITIERDAPVRASDGELGRVKHVVVDPTTREVTDIVVGRGQREWLIPMKAVTGMDGEAIVLNGARNQFRAAPAFHRDQFEAVEEGRAQAEASGRAQHGGVPLRAADESVVVAGEASLLDDALGTPRESGEVAPSGQMPIVPPVAPMDVSEAAPMVAAALNTDAIDGSGDDDATRAGAEAPMREVETVRLADGAAQHLELHEERLRVEKERVEAGVVRVRKVVREWTETVEVPLREERLVLEVAPGSGVVAIDGRELQPGDVLEVPLLEERASVVKETIVSEDVVIRKEETEVEETFEETLRREELELDGDGELDVRDETGGDAGATEEEYETTRTNV